MNNTSSYKDLIIWQKSMDLVIAIYKLTKKLPKLELYGLCSQMQRSAVSIPSNIAEGRHRYSRKDYAHFLQISFSSGTELETQIEICKRLQYGNTDDYIQADVLLIEIQKILNVMTRKLRE